MIENLKTNDQVNPDAANSVECDEQRSSAARVERIVRPVCPPHLSQILGHEVEYGPELRFTPEPERIGNRLVLGEDTKMEVVQCSQIV